MSNKIFPQGKVTLYFFSDSRNALNKEILLHPSLQAKLKQHPEGEFELRLAEVAAHCGIQLDGMYSQEDLDKLCDILLRRLERLRIH